MKTLFFALGLSGSLGVSLAQDLPAARSRTGLPLTVTVFAESITLPTLRKLQKGGIGIKVGTEFYYRNRPGAQTFQTLNLGLYRHPGVQSGLFVASEFGFRKFVGPVFADATIGGGALLLRSVSPAYVRQEDTSEFRKASPYQFKFMPSVGVGMGVRFAGGSTVFARYELFGEMPFSQIVLPHQALHIGTRLLIDK